jgi:hypothetical protein
VRFLNTVQLTERGLLVTGEAIQEAVKVRDHGFVLLDNLCQKLVECTIAHWNVLTVLNV